MLITGIFSQTTFTVDGIKYSTTSAITVAVTSGGTYTGSITIPSSVVYLGATFNVTSIQNFAFYSRTGLTSIIIPNSVTSIGQWAFYNTAWYNNQPDGLVYAGKVAYAYKGTMPAKTSIILNAGTIGIAYEAFYNCTVLTSITIPNSVTSIGNRSFSGCTGLTSITIPSSVTSIGNGSFSGCTGLTSITIPSSVTSIGNGTFSGCTGLTSISIPNSVPSIGYQAFLGTPWFDNQPNGLVYAGKVAYAYKGIMPASTSIILNEGTTEISDYAFSGCTGLGSITFSNSVTSIGNGSFSGCTGLTSINIPNSVTSIGGWAFGNTGWFNSKPDGVVYINKIAYAYKADYGPMPANTSITLNEGTIGIAGFAFDGLSNLTSITIPSSVTWISSGAFYKCTGLNTIYANAITPINLSSNPDLFYDIPKTNTILYVPENSIVAYQADAVWKNFTYIVIASKSVQTSTAGGLSTILTTNEKATLNNLTITGIIDARDFKTMRDEMPKLISVDLSQATVVAYSGTGGTYGGGSTTTYPANAIPQNSFQKKSGLTSVLLPTTVTAIGEGAFANCSALTSIAIPSSVKVIGNTAYSGCSGLKSASIPSSVISIGNFAFSGCSGLTSVSIPSSLISIGSSAFSGCSGLASVSIPSSVISIESLTFSGCKSMTSLSIPSSVTSIGSEAFSGCSALTSVSIPSSVTAIGGSAFYNCSGLKTIYAYNPVPVNLGASTNVFYNVNKSTCSLYVPASSQIIYWVANQWKDFQNIIEGQLPSAVLIPKNELIKVYPNPVRDYVEIKGLESNANVSIYNLQGQNLLNRTIIPNETISVSSLPSGLYIVRVNSRDGAFETKFLKE
jgi:hypothetical protein